MILNETIFIEKNVVYLYKYLPYNDGSLKILRSGTIKYTCPLDFNDPFDCLPAYNEEVIDNLPNTRPDLVKMASKRGRWKSIDHEKKTKDGLTNLKEQIKNGSHYKDIFKKFGIVSLSRNPCNILMWSHYADNHKGFVVGFKISQSNIEIYKKFVPLGVQYSKKIPEYCYIRKINEIISIFLTKHIDWQYEKEFRVINYKSGAGIHEYPRDDILCSVIVGVKMPQENKNNIQKILYKIQPNLTNEVKLFEAKKSNTEYAIIIPDFDFTPQQPFST